MKSEKGKVNRNIVIVLSAVIFAVFIIAGIKLRRPAATRGIASNLCLDCMGLKQKK